MLYTFGLTTNNIDLNKKYLFTLGDSYYIGKIYSGKDDKKTCAIHLFDLNNKDLGIYYGSCVRGGDTYYNDANDYVYVFQIDLENQPYEIPTFDYPSETPNEYE